jgi:hypothetical protein
MTSLRFILSANRRDHILRHFGDNSLAGSHFNPAVFASPLELSGKAHTLHLEKNMKVEQGEWSLRSRFQSVIHHH